MKVGIELDDLKEVMWVAYQERLISTLISESQKRQDEAAMNRYGRIMNELLLEHRKTGKLFFDIED